MTFHCYLVCNTRPCVFRKTPRPFGLISRNIGFISGNNSNEETSRHETLLSLCTIFSCRQTCKRGSENIVNRSWFSIQKLIGEWKMPQGTTLEPMQGKSKNINSVELLSRTLYKLKALFLRTNQLHNVHTPHRSPSASVPTIPSCITACDNATNPTPLKRQLHVHSIEFFGFVGIE